MNEEFEIYRELKKKLLFGDVYFHRKKQQIPKNSNENIKRLNKILDYYGYCIVESDYSTLKLLLFELENKDEWGLRTDWILSRMLNDLVFEGIITENDVIAIGMYGLKGDFSYDDAEISPGNIVVTEEGVLKKLPDRFNFRVGNNRVSLDENFVQYLYEPLRILKPNLVFIDDDEMYEVLKKMKKTK